MFRCHFCQQVTPPKTTRHTVVIETREKHYSTRRRESKMGGGRGGFRGRDEGVQDRGGKGVEIMKEVSACPTCAAKQHEVKTIPSPPPAPVENTEATASEASAETAAPAAEATAPAAEATAPAATEQ